MVDTKTMARFLKINDARVYYSMGRERVKSIASRIGAMTVIDGVTYIDTEKMNKLLTGEITIK